MSSSTTPRQRCSRCQRPLAYCLCEQISTLRNRTRVLVLQHPEEARHPLNTARLAVLGLQHAELWVGEVFEELEATLQRWPRARLLFPEGVAQAQQAGRHPQSAPRLLSQMQPQLAPRLPSQEQLHPALQLPSQVQPQSPSRVPSQAHPQPTPSWQLPGHPQLPGNPQLQGQSQLLGQEGAECGEDLLIVPDGTWRQARRMVRSNPVLQTLPRLSLEPGQRSAYRVRRASQADAVATIEAIALALEQLEPGHDLQAFLRPFHYLVEQQIAAMGEEVYRRHHAGAATRVCRGSGNDNLGNRLGNGNFGNRVAESPP